MSLTWSSVCIKYLLFIFNLLFVVTGIILISVGATIKAYYHDYESFVDDKFFSSANFLIAIGAIIFFIAFFGCCGAIKESFCMTVTFSTLLILVFVLEFAAGISGYVMRSKTEEYVTNKLEESLVKYNTNNDTAAIWDEMQRDFECCGANDYKDWLNISTINQIPLSCCKPPTGALGGFECSANSSTLYRRGCVHAFGDFIRDHAVTVGSVGFGLAFVQLLGIIFSCHLSKQIKKNYETV